jgi:tetratricopeptide (TPR) repeat protein
MELRLEIRRTGKTFKASASFQNTGSAKPYPFKAPFGDEVIEELRWYLEDYYVYPYGPDRDRAQAIEARMMGWGRQLLEAAFSKGMTAWTQFRAAKGTRLLTLDMDDAGLHRLPWELLADEDGHIFAHDIALRRRVHKEYSGTMAPFELPVRVLVVVARPEDVGFIDTRLATRGVLEAVERLDGALEVEVLPAATLAALSVRLRRKPAVHVVHFDGHGGFDERAGHGFLCFENAEGGLDSVARDRLANALTGLSLPLVVLDACQAAKGGTYPFASIAEQLVTAGTGSVIAMPHSVLVPSSASFFAAFYGALAKGDTIAAAINQSRLALLLTTQRSVSRRGDFHLSDWFLPVLYQQETDPAPLAGARPAAARGAAGNSRFANLFPAPLYHFTGRSRDLFELERRLNERPVVVVEGFGGEGKTALAVEAAGWLTRIGRFERAVFVSFAGGLDDAQVIAILGRIVLGEAWGANAGADDLVAELTAHPTLVVWDNFEDVMPGWPSALKSDELEALLALGCRLAEAGRSRLLVTCRPITPRHAFFGRSTPAGRIELKGLGGEDALALAGDILDHMDVDHPQRLDLEDLLAPLGGHPLSIQVVVASLGEHGLSVTEALRRWRTFDAGMAETLPDGYPKSLAASLEYSLSRLGPDCRLRIGALGAFEGGGLEKYIRQVCGLSEVEWAKLAAELRQAGLARSDDGFVTFHPTLAGYLRSRWTAAEEAAALAAHDDAYHGLAQYAVHIDNQSPQEARERMRLEMANVRAAAERLAVSDPDGRGGTVANSVLYFLSLAGRRRETAAFIAIIAGPPDGRLTRVGFIALSELADLRIDQGRPRAAAEVLAGLARRLDDFGVAYNPSEGRYHRFITEFRLGRSLDQLRQPAAAIAAFQRVLEIGEPLRDENPVVGGTIATVHDDMAMAYRRLGAFGQASSHLATAGRMHEELKHTVGLALVRLHQGELAEATDDPEGAVKEFLEAADLFRAQGHWQHLSGALQALADICVTLCGRVPEAERGGLLAQAEAAARECLRLREERLGDSLRGAGAMASLGRIKQEAGRLDEAESWYRAAVDRCRGVDPFRESAALTDLARLWLARHRAGDGGRDWLGEAGAAVQRGMQLRAGYPSDQAAAWEADDLLAEIADAAGKEAAALVHRRTARAAYLAHPHHWEQHARLWDERLARLAGGEGAALLDELPARGWDRLVPALRVVLAGGRDLDRLGDEHRLDYRDFAILSRLAGVIDQSSGETGGTG